MWQEPGEANWVGYLISRYLPHGQKNDVLVYDFAAGGDTVAGVQRQIENGFNKYMGSRSDWEADSSLFITWIGINDCAFPSDIDASLSRLAAAQRRLYDLGARNMLLIDVPPIHRSPAIAERDSEEASKTYIRWNQNLKELSERLAVDCPDATILLFSSFEVFTDILDNPDAHGFPPNHVRKQSGAIWYDHLHPTTKVHDIVAFRMAQFLAHVDVLG